MTENHGAGMPFKMQVLHMGQKPVNTHTILEKCLQQGLNWIAAGVRLWFPWNDPNWEGFIQVADAEKVTEEIVRFFEDNGWCLEVGDNSVIYGAPIVPIAPPEFLYHLTPSSNVETILERGLLTGAGARQSTSGRRYCRDAIYVLTSQEDAKKWVEKKLFQKSGHTEWTILRITSSTLTGRVYRDPASKTGYILEDRQVNGLKVIDRITS